MPNNAGPTFDHNRRPAPNQCSGISLDLLFKEKESIEKKYKERERIYLTRLRYSNPSSGGPESKLGSPSTKKAGFCMLA